MTEVSGNRVARRSPRGDAARNMILASATRLFSGGGFHSVSIADIAKDVGMTQAGLLHHFPSKAALLLAVLMEREVRNDQETREQREKGLDPLTVFLHTLRNNDQNASLVQLMTLLSAEGIPDTHPAHRWFEERYDDLIMTTIVHLTPIIDEAALAEGVTIETLARWLVGLADGLRLQWLYDQSSVSRQHSIALYYDTVMRPMLKEPYRFFSWAELVRRETGK